MEKIDIVLWVLGGGFALMLVMWHSLNKRIDGVEVSLSGRIDKLDEKLTDVDRRLCRLEGAFASKDCCVIKDDRYKKAE